MNSEQWKSALRTLITAFGGMLAGWGAAKGYGSSEGIMSILTNETFIGLVVTFIVGTQGVVAKTATNLIAAVGNLRGRNGDKLVPRIAVSDPAIAKAANEKTTATVVKAS